MNRRTFVARITQAFLTGILLAWITNLVEGLIQTQQMDPRDSGDWVHSFLLYGWFGLASGLLWGTALCILDAARPPRKALFPILLVPGLIFVNAFLVAGYWLNTGSFMPAFGTLKGKLWTLAYGLVILFLCAILALIISKIRRTPRSTSRSASGGAAALVLFWIGLLAVVLPPLYLLVTKPRPSPMERAEVAKGPPVIVILVDTLRRDHLECYGYEKPTSPRLLEFSKDALLFMNSTTTGNMTVPSVATLFTGMYVSEHEVIWATRKLPEDVPTISELFYQAGYRTAAFIGNPVIRPEIGFGRGFDDFYPSPPPRWVHDRKTALELLTIRLVHGEGAEQGSILVDQALDWLRRPSDRTPFVYLHTFEPHSPYDPGGRHAESFLPPNTTELYKMPPRIWNYRGEEVWSSFEDVENPPQVSEHRRQVMLGLYDGEVHLTDTIMGRFFDGLKEMGLYDQSIIVFLADHGEEFDEHGGWFHGLTVFEEMVAMPLLVKLPNGCGGGVRTDLGVDMVDVVPTLCGLSKIRVPEGCTGEDYSRGILGAAGGAEASQQITYFVERPPYLYALRMGRWKILQKTVFGKTTHRLYDLSADPDEQRDLAYTHPDSLARMRSLLKDVILQVTPSEGLSAGEEREKLDPETERMLRALGYIN